MLGQAQCSSTKLSWAPVCARHLDSVSEDAEVEQERWKAQVEWKDTLIMQPSEDGIEEEGEGRVVQKTG